MAKPRRIIRIGISEKAKEAVERFGAKYDMKEFGVASRVYERWGALPEPVQKWFVGLTDGNEGEGMRMFAEMLLKSGK